MVQILGGDDNGSRFFRKSQRFVLLAAADGRCERCLRSLGTDFHSDHVQPYSTGGLTDVRNGAALCPDCNRRKGARIITSLTEGTSDVTPLITTSISTNIDPISTNVVPFAADIGTSQGIAPPLMPRPTPVPLREWQEDGRLIYRRLRDEGQITVVSTACPGTGKRLLGCLLVHEEFQRGATGVVVFVPSEPVGQQWVETAQEWGIILTRDWPRTSLTLPPDTHGLVVTYAQVARLPDALRVLFARQSMLAIFDEIHHGGISRCWGDGVRHAAQYAQSRLCLSGTLWRTDGEAIPFVSTDARGQVRSDIEYPYPAALQDGVVRPAFFFGFGGHVEWEISGVTHSADFDESLTASGQTCRLRAALDPAGGFLDAMIRQAIAALILIRRTHPNAKGMINCIDGVHARAVAALVQAILGDEPAIAIYNDSGAAEVLAQFRAGSAPWLIYVRMASEGYDVPDLRLCVWASTITSELYFWQTVGRLLRIVPGVRYQDAVVYMPADPRLMLMAQRFAAGLAVPLRDEPTQSLREPGETSSPRGRGSFVFGFSEASAPAIVTSGAVIPTAKLQEAQALKAVRPYLDALPDHQVAALLVQVEAGCQDFESLGWSETSVQSSTSIASITASVTSIPGFMASIPEEPGNPIAIGAPAENNGSTETNGSTGRLELAEAARRAESYDEKKRRLRRECNRYSNLIAHELNLPPTKVRHTYARFLGFRQSEATLCQLETKSEILRRKAEELQRFRNATGNS